MPAGLYAIASVICFLPTALECMREAWPDILTLPDLDAITLASYFLLMTPE